MSVPKLDLRCPDARRLAEIHDRRARIATGLHGSRLEAVVLEQRASDYAKHVASCARCAAFLRACPQCGRDASRGQHSFWCRGNEHRWRKLWNAVFGARQRRAAPRARPVLVATPPHEVLGIADGASLTEAREAYRALAKRYHPDLWAKARRRQREAAGRKMREINDAYETFCRRKAEEPAAGG